MSDQELIKELNHLLTRNYDAVKGFNVAKTETDQPLLRAYFQEKIAHKLHYRHELEELIKSLNGEAEEGGSPEGRLHQTWLDIRSHATGNNEEALLEEVERGERAYLGAYEKLLEYRDGMPEHVRRALEHQRNSVRVTLGDVQQMEDYFD